MRRARRSPAPAAPRRACLLPGRSPSCAPAAPSAAAASRLASRVTTPLQAAPSAGRDRRAAGSVPPGRTARSASTISSKRVVNSLIVAGRRVLPVAPRRAGPRLLGALVAARRLALVLLAVALAVLVLALVALVAARSAFPFRRPAAPPSLSASSSSSGPSSSPWSSSPPSSGCCVGAARRRRRGRDPRAAAAPASQGRLVVDRQRQRVELGPGLLLDPRRDQRRARPRAASRRRLAGQPLPRDQPDRGRQRHFLGGARARDRVGRAPAPRPARPDWRAPRPSPARRAPRPAPPPARRTRARARLVAAARRARLVQRRHHDGAAAAPAHRPHRAPRPPAAARAPARARRPARSCRSAPPPSDANITSASASRAIARVAPASAWRN